MASQVSICNQALVKVGATRIVSLAEDEGRPAGVQRRNPPSIGAYELPTHRIAMS